MTDMVELPWTGVELEVQEVRDYLGEDRVLMPVGPFCVGMLTWGRFSWGDGARYDPSVPPYCDRFVDRFGLTWLCVRPAGHADECLPEASPIDALRERERIGGRTR